MKIITKIIPIVCALALMACAEVRLNQVPVENPICPKENSWLCQESEKVGVSLETAYGFLYDGAAIAVITDKVSIQEICDFEGKIASWYDAAYPNIDYDSVINKVLKEADLIEDPAKAILIKNIISKHITVYSNVELINKADDEILRLGHAKFREDMLCD